MQNTLSAFADADKSDVVSGLKKLGGIRDLGSRDDQFETPIDLYKKVCRGFGLRNCDLDACADEKNRKCAHFISERINSLRCRWRRNDLETTHVWCNPPRSKNSKFVYKIYKEWDAGHVGIVALLCWNDLGAKYGQRLFREIQAQNVGLQNLGKVSFLKNGEKTPYASRLSYFAAYFPPCTPDIDGVMSLDWPEEYKEAQAFGGD